MDKDSIAEALAALRHQSEDDARNFEKKLENGLAALGSEVDERLKKMEDSFLKCESFNAVMRVFQGITDKLQMNLCCFDDAVSVVRGRIERTETRLDEGDESRQKIESKADELERQLIVKMHTCFESLRKANSILAQSTYDELREEVIPALVDKFMQKRMHNTKCKG